MKITFRRGMFETNSSTMHSIVINKGDSLESPYLSKDDSLHICDPNGSNFCRQLPRILMNPIAKIKFLICFKAWLLERTNIDWKGVNKEFKENLINICKSNGFNIDIKDLKDRNGVRWSSPDFDDEGFYDLLDFEKYIDDNEFLKKFIFDIKNFIFITGDEYEGFFEISSLIELLDYDHEKIPQIDNSYEFNWYALSDSIYEEEIRNEDND